MTSTSTATEDVATPTPMQARKTRAEIARDLRGLVGVELAHRMLGIGALVAVATFSMLHTIDDAEGHLTSGLAIASVTFLALVHLVFAFRLRKAQEGLRYELRALEIAEGVEGLPKFPHPYRWPAALLL